MRITYNILLLLCFLLQAPAYAQNHYPSKRTVRKLLKDLMQQQKEYNRDKTLELYTSNDDSLFYNNDTIKFSTQASYEYCNRVIFMLYNLKDIGFSEAFMCQEPPLGTVAGRLLTRSGIFKRKKLWPYYRLETIEGKTILHICHFRERDEYYLFQNIQAVETHYQQKAYNFILIRLHQ
ncbi:hypothetical protein [Edaphocola flava]|uniref:hypothetical protein n=1 Tax=Edaphocola flava TaxID=2499629 RepID=UPI00100B836D|nr:hypothetical protein [Edaphocola flava]